MRLRCGEGIIIRTGIFLITAIFLLFGIVICDACASKTAFEEMSIRSGSDSYYERQFKILDYELSGRIESIIILPEGIFECRNDYLKNPDNFHYSSLWYQQRSDIILKNALPEIKSARLFMPNGPFSSLGCDYKMVISAGVWYDRHDCPDKIMKLYEIIQKCAFNEGYNKTAVIINSDIILLD